jgi:hypothetical protein
LILRVMTNKYAESLVSAHFTVFLAPPMDADTISKLSAREQQKLAQSKIWSETGMGYFQIQNTKVPLLLSIVLRVVAQH